MKDEFVVPIDKAGRLVLPKEVRGELAIQPGDVLTVSIRGNEVTLRPNKETSGFVRRGRALIFSAGQAKALESETVNSLLTTERETVRNDIAKGLIRQKRK
jgi:AbrB family looped-hinge helix DNA binding protein